MAKSADAKADKKKQKKKKKAKAPKPTKKTAKRQVPAKVIVITEPPARVASAPKVSPLAPERFPDLPPVSGVRFAAAATGIRYADRADVMLAEITPGAAIAGVFTRSATRAAPVLDCEAKLGALSFDSQDGFAILVNSGNANAFTGAAGEGTVAAVSAGVAEVLGIPAAHVFTASTGVIGEPLPAEKVTRALAVLADSLSAEAAPAAAHAILTTDTFAKAATATAEIGGITVTMMGFAKGSGMIAPDMATMLGFVFTDAAIDPGTLQSLVGAATKRSFNAVTVDGDTSTSDTVLVAATGAAGNAVITSGRSADGRTLSELLNKIMRDLALQIVRDGEGASKFIEVQVSGAKSPADAERVARAIANSPLVKTAIAGEDPNWGRVIMAIGKSGAAADRDRITLHFGDILVAQNGWVAPEYSEAQGAAYMRRQELVLAVDLGLGRGAATMWTCDLTHDYIRINADYRS